MSTTSYLDRFLDPITEAFTPEVARRIAELRADDELQAEIDVLREKANAGTLTPDEEAAYKDFVEAVDLISIVQSKARRFLARCSSLMDAATRDLVRPTAGDRCEYCRRTQRLSFHFM